MSNTPPQTDAVLTECAYLPAGQGKTFWVVGDLVTIKATSAQTNGAFTQIETTVLPNAGPPPHIHTREDEWFTILEGELRFEVGGREVIAGAGATLCGPRNIPHSFRNISGETAKMIVTITPGGIETFFEAAGIPIAGPTDVPATVTGEHIAKLLAAAPGQGIEILPPPQSA